MNKVILLGRLTADPELRQTQSGISSCRFTVAVDRGFTDKNTGERQADFIQCIAWRNTAEFVSRYFNKGKMICIEGSLRNNNYQDKKYPDVTHYGIDVFVDNVEFAGGKNENGQQGQPQPQGQQPPFGNTNGPPPQNGYNNASPHHQNYDVGYNNGYNGYNGGYNG